MTDELTNRRPLKSRASRWAAWLASLLTRSNVTPNSISVASVFFAAIGAACITLTLPSFASPPPWLLWLTAAVCIQLRLLCNLMDGMVAVEGGKGGPCGEIFNDVPDRAADVAILAAAGYATSSAWGEMLGWLCACGAVATAYVRTLATSLTGNSDFRGIMAKPQRMAVMTVACLGQIFTSGTEILWLGLSIIAVGIVVTLTQRLSRLGTTLQRRP